MNRIVIYRGLAVRFSTQAGKDIAEMVQPKDATVFSSENTAADRCERQWGSNAFEHIVFRDAHAREEKPKTKTPVATDQQTSLL